MKDQTTPEDPNIEIVTKDLLARQKVLLESMDPNSPYNKWISTYPKADKIKTFSDNLVELIDQKNAGYNAPSLQKFFDAIRNIKENPQYMSKILENNPELTAFLKESRGLLNELDKAYTASKQPVTGNAPAASKPVIASTRQNNTAKPANEHKTNISLTGDLKETTLRIIFEVREIVNNIDLEEADRKKVTALNKNFNDLIAKIELGILTSQDVKDIPVVIERARQLCEISFNRPAKNAKGDATNVSNINKLDKTIQQAESKTKEHSFFKAIITACKAFLKTCKEAILGKKTEDKRKILVQGTQKPTQGKVKAPNKPVEVKPPSAQKKKR